MNTILPACIASGFLLALTACASHAPLLAESFDRPLDPSVWYVPKHNPAGDGTFVGRTQFRVEQDGPLPATKDGQICATLESYNPKQRSFYGTQIVSKQEFTAGDGLSIIVRTRMTNGQHRGLVGGMFLYSLNPDSDTLHDEIDFELLANKPNEVQTNIYGNEPLGVGNSQMIPYGSGSIADDHIYEIQWTKQRVAWLIDGKTVRTTTAKIPTRPMSFYINLWAPDQYWPEAYSAATQPAKTEGTNSVLDALCVQSVVIRPLTP